MFADNPKVVEKIMQRQVIKNAVQIERFLNGSASILSTSQIQELHALSLAKVYQGAGVIDGERRLGFFDENGKNNMVTGKRLQHELKLLDAQVKVLQKNVTSREDKIKLISFQAMRLFSIHPFNDANKRMVKLMIRNFVEKEFGIPLRPKWQDIPNTVINQAVRGNNLAPFAKAICELYHIPYSPKLLKSCELSPYRIYPDTGAKTYSMSNELKRSQLNDRQVVQKDDLAKLGIQPSKLFKRNPVADQLLSCESTQQVEDCVKYLHKHQKLNDEQAATLVKKVILIDHGTDSSLNEKATKAFLAGKTSTVQEAVSFYDIKAIETSVTIKPINKVHQPKRSLEQTMKV